MAPTPGRAAQTNGAQPSILHPNAVKDEFDVAVVGGGIIGVATAREILSRFPTKTVVVLEKESQVRLLWRSYRMLITVILDLVDRVSDCLCAVLLCDRPTPADVNVKAGRSSSKFSQQRRYSCWDVLRTRIGNGPSALWWWWW